MCKKPYKKFPRARNRFQLGCSASVSSPLLKVCILHSLCEQGWRFFIPLPATKRTQRIQRCCKSLSVAGLTGIGGAMSNGGVLPITILTPFWPHGQKPVQLPACTAKWDGCCHPWAKETYKHIRKCFFLHPLAQQTSTSQLMSIPD